MPTKQQTTQQGQFSPQGMQAYGSLIPAFSQAAQGYINQPFSNPFFQTQQQLGTTQAQNLGGTQMSNVMGNMAGQGFGGTSQPFTSEMMQNQARANTGTQAQLGFLGPAQNALGLQQSAMGQAAGFSPLQTGQQTTQQMTGLGSWLPQLIGGGLSGATLGMGAAGLLGGRGPQFNIGMPQPSGGFNNWAGASTSNPFFASGQNANWGAGGLGAAGNAQVPNTASPFFGNIGPYAGGYGGWQ